jgi:predicted DCC family thiol-disulfide oxidoreductase YuxK
MRALFIFDGDCAFCSSAMRLLRKLPKDNVPDIPFQKADLESFGLSLEQVQSSVWFVAGDVRTSGASAIAGYLIHGGGLWAAAGWILRAPVVLSFAELVYQLVASNRHRLPGGTPECQL